MNPQSAIRNPQSVDPEAAVQLDDLHGASRLTRIAAWLLIQVLAVVFVPARAWGRLKWRCTTQTQCCECRAITRRAWLPFRSRNESRRTSYTWCRGCARKLGIGV